MKSSSRLYAAVCMFASLALSLLNAPPSLAEKAINSYQVSFQPRIYLTNKNGEKRLALRGEPLEVSIQLPSKEFVSETFYRHWGNKHESTRRKALYFFPRLIGRPLYLLFCGKVSQRLIASLELAYKTISHTPTALDIGDTLINPFATLNHLVSDLKGILTIPLYASKQMTSRIKMCTHNLTRNLENKALHLLSPADHILLSIDGGNYQTLQGGFNKKTPEEALNCIPSFKMRNESDSLAIERLRCVDQSNYDWDYHIINFNCGTYCRGILNLAGLANPSLANFGIGDGLNYTPSALAAIEKTSKEHCDTKIKILQSILFNLERKLPLTEHELSFIAQYEGKSLATVGRFAADTILQIILSAAKDERTSNRTHLIGRIHHLEERFDLYLDANRKVAKRYRSMLKKMFADIIDNRSARTWLATYYPGVETLLSRLQES